LNPHARCQAQDFKSTQTLPLITATTCFIKWIRIYRMVLEMNRGMSAYLEVAIINELLSGHPKLVMAQYMMEPGHEIFRRKS
jgi:hypothetical protein